ncbi:MAG: TolC family protein, partial [Candidatus Melainabacteria bacterium]|nr:TolC family protein [Candidatus Melainabacteria bacterium]
RFNVLQSETQLARDEQNLLVQEVALRQAAIQLAAALNIHLGINLLSAENEVRKVRLIDPDLNINELVRLAVLNRPELKQYEQLRLAAKRNIQVVAAALYPQFQFFGSVAGNGATLTPTSTISEGSFSVVPVDTPVEGLTVTNNIGLDSPVYPAGVIYNPATVVRRQIKKSYTLGFKVDWNYLNLGVPDVANVQASRAQARVALLQANQQLINVIQQVRQSYLNSQTAERLIDVTSKAVISATEQLRLSRVRLANGVGTNIDVIEAQRDYITALVNKADAIIQFNNSQAQLVHDIGLISVDNLVSGRLVRQ